MTALAPLLAVCVSVAGFYVIAALRVLLLLAMIVAFSAFAFGFGSWFVFAGIACGCFVMAASMMLRAFAESGSAE